MHIMNVQTGSDRYFDVSSLNYEERAFYDSLPEEMKEGFLNIYDHLRTNASKDPMTDLGNYGSYIGELEKEVAKFDRHSKIDDTDFSVAMFDVINFKYVNEKFGQEFGDQVIKHIARQIGRFEDRCYRVGGDEFTKVLDATNLDQALMLASIVAARINSKTYGHIEGKLQVFNNNDLGEVRRLEKIMRYSSFSLIPNLGVRSSIVTYQETSGPLVPSNYDSLTPEEALNAKAKSIHKILGDAFTRENKDLGKCIFAVVYNKEENKFDHYPILSGDKAA